MFPTSRSIVSAVAFLLWVAHAASAQTAVQVHAAELAIPFGVVTGHLVIVGDQLVFIDESQPDASFALARAEITSLDRADRVVTVTTRKPVRDRSGERSQLRFRVAADSDLTAWYTAVPASKAPAAAPAAPAAEDESVIVATYQAKHDHRVGSCQGRLLVLSDRLAYEAIDEINDSRQWIFADIKELELNGIYKLKVTPFVGNTYNLELIARGMDSQVYRTLTEKIAEARVRP